MSPRNLLAAAGMTAVEAAGVVTWLGMVAAQDSIYVPSAVAGGAVLAAALAVEDAIALLAAGRWPPIPTVLGLAATEVVVWTQWALIVLGGLYSATGVGPAFLVLAVLLVLQHGVEHSLVGGVEPYHPQTVVTAVLEALGATVLWVLVQGGMYWAGVAGLVLLLGLEHTIRMTATP